MARLGLSLELILNIQLFPFLNYVFMYVCVCMYMCDTLVKASVNGNSVPFIPPSHKKKIPLTKPFGSHM